MGHINNECAHSLGIRLLNYRVAKTDSMTILNSKDDNDQANYGFNRLQT